MASVPGQPTIFLVSFWFAGQRNQPHCSLKKWDERPAHQFGLCCYHQHEPTPLPMPPLCDTLTLTLLIFQTLAEIRGKEAHGCPKQPPLSSRLGSHVSVLISHHVYTGHLSVMIHQLIYAQLTQKSAPWLCAANDGEKSNQCCTETTETGFLLIHCPPKPSPPPLCF